MRLLLHPPIFFFYCFCNKNKADNKKQKKKKEANRDKREKRRVRGAEEDRVSLGQELRKIKITEVKIRG